MAIRNNTFILKRSNVVGKIPALSGLTLGELALNTADAKLYSLYTGGATGATEVRQIGWDRLSISGGTLYGETYYSLGTGWTQNQTISYISAATGNILVTKEWVESLSFDSSTSLAVNVATTVALPACTYNNGISGVGATLTRNTSGTTGVIDGITVGLGDRILVKNQASQLQNGVYEVTVVGSVSTPFVLTRTSDSDETSELDPQIVIPSRGTQAGLRFAQTTADPVIGTSNIVYISVGNTSTFVTQSATGTQVSGNIPFWTTTTRELSRGSNTQLFWNNTNKRLGIGTSSPTTTLDVSGKTKTITLQVTSGATVGYVLTALDSNGNVYWAPATTGSTTDTDNFVTGGTFTNNTLTLNRQNGSVNITGFTDFFVTGGTFSSNILTLDRQNGSVTITGFTSSDNFVTGGTYSSGTLTLNRQNGSVTITGITDNFVTGGTYSNGVLTLNRQNGLVTVTGITDTFVTGFTYSNNNLTILQNQGQSPLSVNISIMTGLTINGNLTVTGNTVVRGITGTTALLSSSGQNVLTVIGSGSTLPIFTVQGSQGELFSVTDSLVGSLFSVNDISGLPILEVFSDNTILMGSYLAPSLNTTIRTTANIGSTTIYSVPISAYTGAFFEYTVNDGTNLRAGSIMSIWSGNTVNYTETSTTDIGNTNPITFNMISSSGFASLRTSATTNSWTVKTIVRSI
jgi:hypothetical protein